MSSTELYSLIPLNRTKQVVYVHIWNRLQMAKKQAWPQNVFNKSLKFPIRNVFSKVSRNSIVFIATISSVEF